MATDRERDLTASSVSAPSPYEESLFQEGGVLQIGPQAYTAIAVGLVQQKLEEEKRDRKELGREAKQRVREFMKYQELMCGWVGQFQDIVPQSWLESDNIIRAYREAKTQGVQLSARLINPGLVHPSGEVRTALWESQELTGEQKAIVACYGVNPSDPQEKQRAGALAVASMPYLPIFMKELF